MKSMVVVRKPGVRPTGRHEWVGAAVVGLGRGRTERAEHAARTGRHTLPSSTRIEVLEVYCKRCRVGYSSTVERGVCTGVVVRGALKAS